MIKKTSSVLCLILFSLSNQVFAQQQRADISPSMMKKIDDRIEQTYQEYHLQGDFLIGLVGPTGLLYSKALNRSLLENKESKLDNNTPFFLASHTKAFTGTLLKILEEEGKVDLNKSIHYYLPNLVTSEKIDPRTITVKQLLNHTSGFTSVMHAFKTAFLGYEENTDELRHALNYKMLSAPPGKFRYSNTGPIIAGMIVEKVTGNSWQTEMQARIFSPLLMSTTSSKVSNYKSSSILPSIETTANNRVFRSGFYKDDNTMHAAGGTISTINDLARWLKFNINQEQSILRNQESFTELHQSTTAQNRRYFSYQRRGYSLGWDIADYRGETVLTRFGGNGGISFHASFIPSKKLGIIAFFNEERAHTFPHLIANYIYNTLLDKENSELIYKEERNLFQKSYTRLSKLSLSYSDILVQSKENDNFVGLYENREGWPKLSISKDSNSYSVKWGRLSGPLIKLANDSNSNILAALGPLKRKIKLVKENDQIVLTNGSIRFTKSKVTTKK